MGVYLFRWFIECKTSPQVNKKRKGKKKLNAGEFFSEKRYN